MTTFGTLIPGLAALLGVAGLALAEPAPFVVGDAMPAPDREHFVVTFTIKCTEADSVRVDRFEHDGRTAVVAYGNDNEVPYGYYLVHANTLLLDNAPQDGTIDSVAVLSMNEDVKICGALP